MVRPRTVSLEPDEMIELGKEMVDWCFQNDPLHLSQWYTIHKNFTYNQWKQFIAKEEFHPYYEKALKIVGIKYLDGESKKIKDGISQRWQRIYFKDLKEGEDEDAKFHSSLKREENRDIPPLDDMNEKDNKIMELEAKLAKALGQLDNQSKAESQLS